jgi:hypothetical protein
MTEPISHTIQVLMLDAMHNAEHDRVTRTLAAQMIIESASERGWIDDDEFYALSSQIDKLAITELQTEEI